MREANPKEGEKKPPLLEGVGGGGSLEFSK